MRLFKLVAACSLTLSFSHALADTLKPAGYDEYSVDAPAGFTDLGFSSDHLVLSVPECLCYVAITDPSQPHGNVEYTMEPTLDAASSDFHTSLITSASGSFETLYVEDSKQRGSVALYSGALSDVHVDSLGDVAFEDDDLDENFLFVDSGAFPSPSMPVAPPGGGGGGGTSAPIPFVVTAEVYDAPIAPTPEPSTLFLVATGLLGASGAAMRRRA